MKNLIDKIDFILNERRKTTRVEMIKAKRQLKIEKSKDTGLELYDDFVNYLSTYLNSMDTQDLVKYKAINRAKAQEIVQDMASSTLEMQAVLDKLHLDPEKFVARYWTLKDMKLMIQDTVDILLKGGKPEPTPVVESSGPSNKRETPEEAGMTVVKTKGNELYLKDKDTGKTELWVAGSSGVAGYGIVYKGKAYEFVREVK